MVPLRSGAYLPKIYRRQQKGAALEIRCSGEKRPRRRRRATGKLAKPYTDTPLNKAHFNNTHCLFYFSGRFSSAGKFVRARGGGVWPWCSPEEFWGQEGRPASLAAVELCAPARPRAPSMSQTTATANTKVYFIIRFHCNNTTSKNRWLQKQMNMKIPKTQRKIKWHEKPC